MMSRSMSLTLLIVLMVTAVSITPSASNSITNCWKTWSRCTKWSSAGTGILWQSCKNRCRCLGYNTGVCKLAPSNCPLTDEAWQCKCSGTRVGDKPSWCGY